jgi:hypothetical protein
MSSKKQPKTVQEGPNKNTDTLARPKTTKGFEINALAQTGPKRGRQTATQAKARERHDQEENGGARAGKKKPARPVGMRVAAGWVVKNRRGLKRRKPVDGFRGPS